MNGIPTTEAGVRKAEKEIASDDLARKLVLALKRAGIISGNSTLDHAADVISHVIRSEDTNKQALEELILSTWHLLPYDYDHCVATCDSAVDLRRAVEWSLSKSGAVIWRARP